MRAFAGRKIVVILGVFLAVWLTAKYLLPVLLPFLLGGLLALAAEPAVRFGVQRLKLSRGLAVGLGVTLTLVLLIGVLSLIGALAVKELGNLTKVLPDIQSTMQQGITLLQDWLIGLADRLPDGARSLVTQTVLELLGGGSVLLNQVTSRLPGVLTSVLGWIPDGALGLGTGILAGFMISARLPRLRQMVSQRIPQSWREKYLPALERMRKAVGGWLKAQGTLALVTYGIVAAGLMLLRVPYGAAWAVLVALVDAVPILGTGTVLLPWALVWLLQGEGLRALGLIAVYGTALLARTVLEPRLVGRHLGLDPLLTLVFLYLGYRFWGILGMIFAPMLAAAAKSLTETAS